MNDRSRTPGHPALRKSLRVLSILLGCLLFWWAVRAVDLATLMQSLRNAAPLWLALTLLSVLFSLLLKAWRWYGLLKPVLPEVSFKDTLGMLMVGQSGNIVLPSRSGDVLRALYASAPDQAQIPAVATGIVVEKASDALFLSLALALALPWLPETLAGGYHWRTPLLIALIGGLLTVVVLFTSASFWGWLRSVLSRRTNPLRDWLVTQGDCLIQGVERLRQQGQFRAFLLLTIVIWINMILTNMLLAQAMGIPVDMKLGLLVVVLAYIAVIPGLMPGHIGPFYFLVGLGLTSLAIAPTDATAYAVLLHLFVMLPPLILAGIYLILRREKRIRLQKVTQG